jgi:hypothetical protein
MGYWPNINPMTIIVMGEVMNEEFGSKTMPDQVPPALTPEQWEARDYRQTARELDSWAKQAGRKSAEDSTEYVAKLGLNENGSVIVMNRAHDRVLVPPPARAALAAFALAEQPFGFSQADVAALRAAEEAAQNAGTARSLGSLAARLQALLPPSEDVRGER